MWIKNLTNEQAESVFGRYWHQIVSMTLELLTQHRPSCPDALSHEEYEGTLYLYGKNGPSVFLFLREWQSIYKNGVIPTPSKLESEIIKVTNSTSLEQHESAVWRDALLDAGYQHRGDTQTNVWYAGMKIGLEVGQQTMRFLAGASAGELAQMPQKNLHFFLDMMPWVRCGQVPSNWHDESNRLVVDWLEPDELKRFLEYEASRHYEENLWPTTGVGLRVQDEEAFIRAAKESGNVILVADASPARLQYIGQSGFRPRPPNLPGRTRSNPPHVGLIAALEEGTLPPGYLISAEEDGRLIRDHAGNAFYDAFELIGVYDLECGTDSFSASFLREMNRRLGEDLIQAGPSDSFVTEDLKLGSFRQLPLTAYMPDRAPLYIGSEDELREFYEEYEIKPKGGKTKS